MPSEQNERIYKCPKCDVYCIKNIETLRDGTVTHTLCGTEVVDVTEQFDKAGSAPSDIYD